MTSIKKILILFSIIFHAFSLTGMKRPAWFEKEILKFSCLSCNKKWTFHVPPPLDWVEKKDRATTKQNK